MFRRIAKLLAKQHDMAHEYQCGEEGNPNEVATVDHFHAFGRAVFSEIRTALREGDHGVAIEALVMDTWNASHTEKEKWSTLTQTQRVGAVEVFKRDLDHFLSVLQTRS
jgi:hypothetical protein